MFASLARIAILAILAVGGYKLYPRLAPTLGPALKNPQVLGARAAIPIIRTINQILPDNIQLPTPKPAQSAPDQTQSSNPSSTNPSTATNAIVNQVIEEVKQKAGEMAQDQIDAAKKEAGKAFCAALLEKIKTECGN